MANVYMKAFFLTAAIVLLAFFFINQLDLMRATDLQRGIDSMLFDSESERLVYAYTQLMGNDTQAVCSYASSTAKARATRAYELSEKIRYFEQSNVVNADYERIKEQYYLANAALYVNVQTAAKYCGTGPYTTILFFYKTRQDCPECQAQGAVLDSVVKGNSNVRVFAFPIDTDYEFVNMLARGHNATSAPSIVVNEGNVLSGLHSEDEIRAILPSVTAQRGK
ncbi:MAG: hypothetical protein NT051_04280 [Candidatus Micrarchaeota archaeon]|nr:hypothetical protein [Candidatus Micrarchaeota archaeon]